MMVLATLAGAVAGLLAWLLGGEACVFIGAVAGMAVFMARVARHKT